MVRNGMSPEVELIISQLKKFYKVDTVFELVIEQDRHINKLQEKLKRAGLSLNYPVSTRVRVGD